MLDVSLPHNNRIVPVGHSYKMISNDTFCSVDVLRVIDLDVSMNGIELQDREFFAAIAEGREPNSSAGQVLDCYRVLDEIEHQF